MDEGVFVAVTVTEWGDEERWIVWRAIDRGSFASWLTLAQLCTPEHLHVIDCDGAKIAFGVMVKGGFALDVGGELTRVLTWFF